MFTIYTFKNNKRKKKLKSFIREKLAINYFNKLINDSNNIKFEKRFENGHDCYFHLGIVSSEFTSDKIYITDEFGRNIIIDSKIDDNNYLVKLSSYKVNELIYDVKNDSKISLDDFIKKYIKSSKIYMISKLKNKFILQEDDNYLLFSLKNEDDCERFLDIIIESCPNKNVIPVKDISSAQRKYLYNMLVERGFNKKFLYTSYTTYPK
jgi:hypothetical protein